MPKDGLKRPNHLSLAASNDRPLPPQRRAEFLQYAAGCLDMLSRTKDPHDRAVLRGMAQVWTILADRELP